MRTLFAILIFASCLSASAQTTTSCGETSETGIDGGDALWQLGTPCSTGTNSGGYTVSSISYWVGTPTSASFNLGVYSNASSTPSTLLCSVSTGTITPASGWNSVNISSCPTLSASTTYWVGYITGSNAIEQGTVSGACPGTSFHSTWANAPLSGVSLSNPFPANTQGVTCYSLYMTLNAATTSPGPLTITTTSLPSGQVGTAYSAMLGATGGTIPYTWSLISGTLPAGLTLNASTGMISGMPTATANATALTFKVIDSSSPVQNQSIALSLTVNSAQTSTSCGEMSQTGIDGGDALWPLGTPCSTGSNSGGYTVSSISYWVGTPTSASFNLGVYSNASSTPSTLLCSVSTGTITPASGWNSVNISSCPTLSASTTYWVGYITGSNAIEQGTVSGACPGTSFHSTWANAPLSGVSLSNPFPANTQGVTCYSLYMTLNAATTSPGPLTITTTSLPSGQVGTAYSAMLGATGGTIPYTWSLISGTLPAGLTLNASTGMISGMPTATANATALTFKVIDSSSPVQNQSATFSLTISPATLAIATTSLHSGQVGTAYTATLAATGGTTPYTWSLTSGTLPAGLTLNGSTGAITGTPTATANATSLTFKVTDSGSPVQNQSAMFSLTIAPATLAIATTSLHSGQVGTAYTATLVATGGTAPYTWSLTSGTLPAGLTLNGSTGAITGTPTATANATSLTFKVIDSSSPVQNQSAMFSLTIAPATLAIATTSLHSGQVGTAYTATLVATGGTAPYTWSLTSGTLPAGLTLNGSTGAITGTPTATANATSLTFKVIDSSSPAQNQSATLSLTISPAALTISTTSLPSGQVGTAYTATLAATGGTIPYTWSLTSGTLPAGLTLNGSTGAITGTPTATANATALTFKVTDSGSPAQNQSATFSMTISPVTLAIATTSLPGGQVGSRYTATLAATGGTAPYTWSLTSGTLPAGLTLNASTGMISGTPTATANATSLTFKVTDSSSPVQNQSIALSLTVNSAQTSTSCGEMSQTGIDGGDALWPLGTPCSTGTNSGGYTVSSISYWVGTPTSASFNLGVYSNASSTPSTLLCSVSTGTITPASGWNSVNISGCPTLSASTTYWVGYITGSNAIEQGTVSGACPGTSFHSTWANAPLSGVSLSNPFPANTQGVTCYSLYMTLNAATTSPGPLTITTTSLPSGQVGTAYTATLAATGGTAPYTWSLTSGTLPAGLTLNASTGMISGMPTATANATALTFKVIDSSSPVQNQSANLTMTVTSLAITVSVSPTEVGLAITQPLSIAATTNDGAGVNWSASGSGCSGSACGTFSASNSLTGLAVTYTAPGTAGTYTITATSATNSSVFADTFVHVTDLAGVTTYHNNLSRNGSNTQEYLLSSSTVTSSTFGKLFSCTVDEAIYAQPLWVSNLTVNGATHNVVFVATQNDSLYAFDADNNTTPCTPLWHANLLDTAHGGTSGEGPVPSSGTGHLVGYGGGDIAPEVGVTGTPVIDPSTNTLYVVSKSYVTSGPTFFQRLHAIDLLTGNEKFSGPANIAATYPSSGGTITFSPRQENQRCGLALVSGVVYVAWASHEDVTPYYGWVMGYNASNLSLSYVFNDDPNSNDGGIWMSGGAPAADASGNLYLITGNGGFDANSTSAPNNDYGDSFLKLTGNLTVSSYFTPSDQQNDALNDNDFGAGGAAVLLDLPANGSNPTQLVAGGGKDGALYLLNRSSLGGYGDTGAWEKVGPLSNGIYSTPAFWNNTLYLALRYGTLQAFPLNTSTYKLPQAPTSTSSVSFGVMGATPSVSAMPDGTNGIVWALDNSNYCTPNSPACGPTVLHALNASNLGNEYWNSGTTGPNKAGNAIKFTVPTVANGKVYIGTRGNNAGGADNSTSIPGELDVYGVLN